MPIAPLGFGIHPSSRVTTHRQLIDQVSAAIADDRLAPGEGKPGVRTLASAVEVSPMRV